MEREKKKHSKKKPKMPNTYVMRVVLFGNEKTMDQLFKTHFYQDKNGEWRSRFLMQEDPLLYQIKDSGPFVKTADSICFSTYMGYDMHETLWQKLARDKLLSQELFLAVVGFDLDDISEETTGNYMLIQGQTGFVLKRMEPLTTQIIKDFFPRLEHFVLVM